MKNITLFLQSMLVACLMANGACAMQQSDIKEKQEVAARQEAQDKPVVPLDDSAPVPTNPNSIVITQSQSDLVAAYAWDAKYDIGAGLQELLQDEPVIGRIARKIEADMVFEVVNGTKLKYFFYSQSTSKLQESMTKEVSNGTSIKVDCKKGYV